MGMMRTDWFEKVSKTCPLPEYPRPQFEREDWLCLNGEYDYAVTKFYEDDPAVYEGKILVPFALESELSGVCRRLSPDERLWYKKNFTLNSSFEGKRTILHFEAVDYKCTVWVNGESCGTHIGGYNPFAFDITDKLVEGENELKIKVYDPTDYGHQQRGKQFHKSQGFWYTPTSGIWQTVWLEPVCENRIEKIKILPDIDTETVKFEALTLGEGKLSVKIKDGENVVFEGTDLENNTVIPLPGAKLWSPESPFLYDVELSFGDDKVKSYFGMRKFSIIKDEKGLPRLALNNKPYFQRGLLDQGYWPESQLTPPTDEAMIFDIAKMKEYGFNMLRKHIKREPMRWYYHCDRLGMLVWQDMISGGKPLNLIYAGGLPNINVHVKDNQYKAFNRDKKEWRDEFEDELFEMIDDLYSVTSICCWVPFNEGWGQFDAKRIGEKIKAVDPSRFVDHASGWHDQHGPDFKSVHKYIFPIHLPTAHRTAGRPFVLSEYGGYSWNIVANAWKPEKSFGYVQFKDCESLSTAYEKLHEKQVIPLIEKGLCATVYTQVSDVEFEVNGIYTYDRKILKISADTLKKVNGKLKY